MKIDINSIAEHILSFHLESAGDIDDIMESLQDYGLLNSYGKEVRKRIREITRKQTPDTYTYEDRMMEARKSFSKQVQRNLIEEYHKKNINKRASNFIKKHILPTYQLDDDNRQT